MTKTFALLALAGTALTANAQILVADSFNYPDGNLVGNGGWANHSGSGSFIQVDNGVAYLNHGGGSREDASVAFTPTGGTLYYGIDFKVSDDTQITGGDYEYFAHFKDDGFAFRGRLDIVEGTSGGDFSVGIATGSSTADAVWGTDLSFDTYYRAIVGYNQDTNQAQLWIDASLESDTSILGADNADPGDAMTSFALRQSNSSNDETVMVDNLIVGTTFGSVVPTPASASILALGGLVATRRRRA